MKFRSAILVLLATVLPAGSQTETVVSPSDFRDYAEGHTLYFEENGEPAGAESFGPDGHVIWQGPDGTCIEGLWRPHGEELCFYYGIRDDVQCWNVLRDEEGLKVRLAGDELEAPDLTYRITGRDRQPLLCGGPSFETRGGADRPFSPPAPPQSRS